MPDITNPSGSGSLIIKHKRASLSVPAASSAGVTLTWDSAFADTNYTVVAIQEDPGTTSRPIRLFSKTTTSVNFTVQNTDAVNPATVTVHAIAIHD